jgi:hypothetical protein
MPVDTRDEAGYYLIVEPGKWIPFIATTGVFRVCEIIQYTEGGRNTVNLQV